MDKKIAGLLGAVAALSTVGAVQASAPNANPMQANSYADLLKPVPNATAALAADDASRAKGRVKTAQLSVEIGHHHHHHHHHHRRIIIRHHHHHHHHRIIIRHHHHHHHSQYMAVPRKDA